VANYQIKDITSGSTASYTVNKVSYAANNGVTKRCYSCGLKFPHLGECPVKHKKCNKCGIIGHFENTCRQDMLGTKKNNDVVNTVDTTVDTTENDDYAFAVSGGNGLPRTEVKVNGYFISCVVDTGSTGNIVDEMCFEGLKKIVNLKSSSRTVYPYKSDDPLPMLGEFEAEIKWKDRVSKTCFIVVKGEADCLIVVLMFNRSNFTKLPNIDLSELDWNKNLKIAIRNDNKSAIATETRCNDNLKFRKVDLKPGD
ncbi:hypothetical protein BpHYR1_010162, partial [Brachionus plicatilis]